MRPRYEVLQANFGPTPQIWHVCKDGNVIDTYADLAIATAYVDFMNDPPAGITEAS